MEKRSRGWTLAYQSPKYLNLVENELLHSIPKQSYSCPHIHFPFQHSHPHFMIVANTQIPKMDLLRVLR